MNRGRNHTTAGLAFVLVCLLIAFAIYVGMKGGEGGASENTQSNIAVGNASSEDLSAVPISNSTAPAQPATSNAAPAASEQQDVADKAWTKHANLAGLIWTDYPAPKFQGPITLPDFDGAEREHRDFRTVLGGEAKQGVNFAGHYRAAWIGCGMGCTQSYVIDEATGHIEKNDLSPHGVAVVKDDGDQSGTEDIDFRPDSNLVLELAHDTVNGEKTCFFNAYVWTGSGLKQISTAQEPAPDGGNDEMLGDGSYCTPSAPGSGGQ